jgi:hypothetical protein
MITAAELRWMCHLWEPMRCWYQPLGFYLFMEAAALLGALALRAGEPQHVLLLLLLLHVWPQLKQSNAKILTKQGR